MNNETGTILIVDDEATITRLLNRTLSAAGYRCVEASDTVQAREKLDTEVIELTILDVKMPGRSGIEFLPEIAADFPDIAVIMATAVDDSRTVVQAMKHGAYDYLLKPFNPDEVMLSVNKALELRRLRIENRDYQLNLEKKVKEQTVKIRESFLNSLKALVRALEAKDEYTSNHSRRVAEISASLAREMGLSPEYTEKIMVAGLIHDIGKIGIKEGIINKPGHLSGEEYKEVQQHPAIAAEILITVVDDNEIIEAIVHHHERYDGTGYPEGLKGEKIPIGARILAVADAYDAMVSVRPYRLAMNAQAVNDEIKNNRGIQFDPFVADAMLRFIIQR